MFLSFHENLTKHVESCQVIFSIIFYRPRFRLKLLRSFSERRRLRNKKSALAVAEGISDSMILPLCPDTF